jgi:hypothetical protein
MLEQRHTFVFEALTVNTRTKPTYPSLWAAERDRRDYGGIAERDSHMNYNVFELGKDPRGRRSRSLLQELVLLVEECLEGSIPLWVRFT